MASSATETIQVQRRLSLRGCTTGQAMGVKSATTATHLQRRAARLAPRKVHSLAAAASCSARDTKSNAPRSWKQLGQAIRSRLDSIIQGAVEIANAPIGPKAGRKER